MIRKSVNDLIGRLGYHVRRSDELRRARLLIANNIDLVFDVGAASGLYGRDLRRHGFQGTIVSFEPLPDAFGKLMSRSSSDPKWFAENCALGSERCEARINVAGNSDSSSLLGMGQRHVTAAPQSAYVGTELVEVRRLDEFSEKYRASSRKCFAKIDVQGYELAVLDGASELLSSLAGIQVELSLAPLYDEGPSYVDVLERLTNEGFQLVAVEPGFYDRESCELLQMDGLFFRLKSLC